MMEPKPFASLSASLLARKGTARPAMRRAYATGGASPTLPLSVQDDLGWNDMGHPHHEIPAAPPPLTMIKADAGAAAEPAAKPADEPEVLRQQADLAQQMTPAPAAKASPVSIAMRPRSAKAAFTLRLDPQRHLLLRLACAVGNRSAQQIVTDALDAFLGDQPQLEDLAKRVPLEKAKSGKRKSK